METKRGVLWGTVFVIIVILAYLIPYTALTEVHAWYGSFLFWAIVALVIIGFNFLVTRNWGK
ncbi:putative membrane protein [Pullulanibacillus pueri]|uniref:Uncharacterized protein n=1 Tax=Pullulanibacillus pueri TaxID=1437324 RepID=A0A8J2ZY09_9BACL|nr:hypothetical protein [Pullulanibacillus pueri]MBM7682882.1 putative membrane protein [Pullulanibacillus pueri]GGH84377.1 hypothetical protein GCM10007096_27310 [Pullulanibacillus pueri]